MEKQTEYSETLASALNTLSSKLGVKAEELYATVIKQSKIELVMEVIFLVLYIVMLVLGIYGIREISPIWFSEERIVGGKAFFVVMGSFGSVIFLIVPIICIFSSIRDIVTLIFNPKYWALNDILSSLRN